MRFAVHVTPKSRADEIRVDPSSRTIRVRVTAAAESGKANDAVLALLREKLGLRAGALRIKAGATSRTKWIEADGLEENDLWHRLEAE
ncbi:MAG TPA: DUF167 domain-containing protein [Candidatus Eisenbacteria bacterium]|nr:DUF167 domain-containing protein [Candidatus Eisenbacteria bacterium]